MGQHAEHEVESSQVGDVERGEHGVAVRRGQRGIEVGDPCPRVRCRRDVDDLDLRVGGEQPERFGPRIA